MNWETYLSDVLPFYIRVTKGYGITVEDINNGCPTDFKPYVDAYDLETKEHDAEMHRNGIYTLKAFSVALANAFSKNSKAQYFEKPLLLGEIEKKDSNSMSEKELQLKREKFVMGLMAMQSNFELNHPKKESEDNE